MRIQSPPPVTQAAQSPAQALQRLQLILGYVWYLGRGKKLWYNAEIMVQPPRAFVKFSIPYNRGVCEDVIVNPEKVQK